MGLHHTPDPICPLCADKLSRAHEDLVSWFMIVKAQFIDAHVSWSYRDEEAQEAAFDDGKTRLHYPNSAHNELPSSALDLFQIIQEQAIWDPKFFVDLADFNSKKFPHILWGGRWKTLGDYDHFELVDKEDKTEKE